MTEDASIEDLLLVEIACTLVRLRGRTTLTDHQVTRFLELVVSLVLIGQSVSLMRGDLDAPFFPCAQQSTNIDIEAAKELAAKIESSEFDASNDQSHAEADSSDHA